VALRRRCGGPLANPRRCTGHVSEQEATEAQPEGLPVVHLLEGGGSHLHVGVSGVLEGGTALSVLLPGAPIRAVDVSVVLTDDPLGPPQEVSRRQPPTAPVEDGDVELRLGEPS
jgi:hypothetical protein